MSDEDVYAVSEIAHEIANMLTGNLYDNKAMTTAQKNAIKDKAQIIVLLCER